VVVILSWVLNEFALWDRLLDYDELYIRFT